MGMRRDTVWTVLQWKGNENTGDGNEEGHSMDCTSVEEWEDREWE